MVVAGIVSQHTSFDFDDSFDDAIEQPPVMAHDQDGTFVFIGKKILQPLSSVDVEVVGGFVEKKHVRALQQESSQSKPCFLATGQSAHLLSDLCLGESQPMQRGVDLVVDRVAALGADFGFQIG